MNEQNGVTFIEFAVFMSIFVLSAAFAFVKFSELTKEAQMSATTAIASSLTANNATNYIFRQAKKKSGGIPISDCADVVNTLPSGLPAGYSVESYPVENNASIACTLNGPAASATFTATGVS